MKTPGEREEHVKIRKSRGPYLFCRALMYVYGFAIPITFSFWYDTSTFLGGFFGVFLTVSAFGACGYFLKVSEKFKKELDDEWRGHWDR